MASLSYDSSTRFPGSMALLPCIGTALLIYSNSVGSTTVAQVLSHRGLVSLGLMSYSLYLWHWPILAFQRCCSGGTVPVVSRVVALSVSLFLAYFSWKFVKALFRKGGKFKSGGDVLRFHPSICSALLVVVSLWMHHSKGLPSRLPEDALHIQRPVPYRDITKRTWTELEREIYQKSARRLPRRNKSIS